MSKEIESMYKKIVQDSPPLYLDPETQGNSIKKYSLLEQTNVCYGRKVISNSASKRK